MKGILSIQSHVVFGYVGNKAATFPLQCMGYDVWPINTVQFSNHTGYNTWQGEIFSAKHIRELVDGIFALGQQHNCLAVLSGYMGSLAICQAVRDIVQQLKKENKEVLYLCDPVIGDKSCYVKPEVLDYFKNNLSADIITPNQYEAEILSNISIKSHADLGRVASFFHSIGIKVVVITGVKLPDIMGMYIYASENQKSWLLPVKEQKLNMAVNGMGDLFSSVFLGSYLKHRDTELAALVSNHYLEQVLKNTSALNMKELQVLSVKYEQLARADMLG